MKRCILLFLLWISSSYSLQVQLLGSSANKFRGGAIDVTDGSSFGADSRTIGNDVSGSDLQRKYGKRLGKRRRKDKREKDGNRRYATDRRKKKKKQETERREYNLESSGVQGAIIQSRIKKRKRARKVSKDSGNIPSINFSLDFHPNQIDIPISRVTAKGKKGKKARNPGKEGKKGARKGCMVNYEDSLQKTNNCKIEKFESVGVVPKKGKKKRKKSLDSDTQNTQTAILKHDGTNRSAENDHKLPSNATRYQKILTSGTIHEKLFDNSCVDALKFEGVKEEKKEISLIKNFSSLEFPKYSEIEMSLEEMNNHKTENKVSLSGGMPNQTNGIDANIKIKNNQDLKIFPMEKVSNNFTKKRQDDETGNFSSDKKKVLIKSMLYQDENRILEENKAETQSTINKVLTSFEPKNNTYRGKTDKQTVAIFLEEQTYEEGEVPILNEKEFSDRGNYHSLTGESNVTTNLSSNSSSDQNLIANESDDRLFENILKVKEETKIKRTNEKVLAHTATHEGGVLEGNENKVKVVDLSQSTYKNLLNIQSDRNSNISSKIHRETANRKYSSQENNDKVIFHRDKDEVKTLEVLGNGTAVDNNNLMKERKVDDHQKEYILPSKNVIVVNKHKNQIADHTLDSDTNPVTPTSKTYDSEFELNNTIKLESNFEVLKEKKNPTIITTGDKLLRLRKSEDHSSDISVSIVSWNLAEELVPEDDAKFIRKFRDTQTWRHDGEDGSDIVLISSQECENIKPRRTEGHRSRELRRIMIKMLGKEYVPLALHSLGGIQFGLFCKHAILSEIEFVSLADVTCGIGNVIHNKGAIGAFLQMKARKESSSSNKEETRAKSLKILFVAAHMAAHVKNVDARNMDYWRIASELEAQAPPRFLPPKNKVNLRNGIEGTGSYLMDSVDRIFFCGDLNYRIDLPRESTESCITKMKTMLKTGYNTSELGKLLIDLLLHDQLLNVISQGVAFPGFSEGKITFMPTFKFDKGTTEYDTSYKQRIPAWTDRILYKPSGTRVLHYKSETSSFNSDHRPVHATFRVSTLGRIIEKIDDDYEGKQRGKKNETTKKKRRKKKKKEL